MDLSLFDYHLPKESIAQEPARPRDSSKLLVLREEDILHEVFTSLPNFLEPRDVLVLNDTRVLRARLKGQKKLTGGKVELTLLAPATGPDFEEEPVNRGQDLDSLYWTALLKGKKIKPGLEILLSDGWTARLVSQLTEGEFLVEFSQGGNSRRFGSFLAGQGKLPLPPYIKKDPERPEDYQTLYAEQDGSVAAPTAGLHFTNKVFEDLEKKGVKLAKLTLHVGLGTFLPVKAERVEDHHMHQEWYSLDRKNAEIINSALAAGGRLVAVGTTSLRVLESLEWQEGAVVPGSGSTGIFIYPGYVFCSPISLLLTNFHLPRSTLLMLVAAFAGRERVLRAYERAKETEYRFFSFGDACLLFREG